MSSLVLYLMGFLILVGVSYSFTRAAHPILSAIKSALCGIGTLMLVNVTAGATSCYIAVNLFTAFVACVLSVPGVIAMLFLNIIFI
ncbi:MAG: pro-sigmaK processing inhibitor BofA family protein [Oscillospiraceae bacterium]